MENSANAAVIKPKGIIIEVCIEVFEKILIEAGWCSVDHQSTEYLIIGIFIAPNIAIKEVILLTFSVLS